jgi:zinc protease
MHRSLLALALTAAGTAPAAAQVFPHPVRVEKLPNGLTVVTSRFDAPGIAAQYILVRAGSRNEVDAGYTGYAHFFEHMMFRGTERFPADAYDRTLQLLGADNNAYTSENQTCYTVVLPASALPTLEDVESDRFRNLAYTVEGFQTEAHTIAGEYLTAISDPMLKMEETIRRLAFTQHSYGHTVIGWQEDIARMPEHYDYSRDYFRRHYTPDNAFVIVAGDVDHDAVVALVRDKFGAWEGTLDAREVPVEPEQAEARREDLTWPGPAPFWLLVGWKIPAFRTDTVDSAALDVATELIFGETSDLYRRFVVEEQKLLTLDPWGAMDRDPGLLFLDAKLTERIGFDEAIAALQEAIDAVAAGPVDAQRVEDVKNHLRYGLPMALETPADVAGLLAQFIAITGDPQGADEYVRRISEVTPADVSRVAAAYLAAARRNAVTLSPSNVLSGGEGGEP